MCLAFLQIWCNGIHCKSAYKNGFHCFKSVVILDKYPRSITLTDQGKAFIKDADSNLKTYLI